MVNYSYYREVYYGDKVNDGQLFNRLQGNAKRMIEQQTFGRSKKVTDKDTVDMIKITICQLIDNFASVEKMGIFKSESIDDYSYTVSSTKEDMISEQSSIIMQNLGGTGLLYRGWYHDD